MASCQPGIGGDDHRPRFGHGVLRRDQEMVTTSSTSEVIAEWEKERELVGDVAKTYLDLVFLPNTQINE